MKDFAKDNYIRKGMDATVEDYQKPASCYSQASMNKTLEYEARHNRFETQEANEIKKQAYQGRYS